MLAIIFFYIVLCIWTIEGVLGGLGVIIPKKYNSQKISEIGNIYRAILNVDLTNEHYLKKLRKIVYNENSLNVFLRDTGKEIAGENSQKFYSGVKCLLKNDIGIFNRIYSFLELKTAYNSIWNWVSLIVSIITISISLSTYGIFKSFINAFFSNKYNHYNFYVATILITIILFALFYFFCNLSQENEKVYHTELLMYFKEAIEKC